MAGSQNFVHFYWQEYFLWHKFLCCLTIVFVISTLGLICCCCCFLNKRKKNLLVKIPFCLQKYKFHGFFSRKYSINSSLFYHLPPLTRCLTLKPGLETRMTLTPPSLTHLGAPAKSSLTTDSRLSNRLPWLTWLTWLAADVRRLGWCHGVRVGVTVPDTASRCTLRLPPLQSHGVGRWCHE